MQPPSLWPVSKNFKAIPISIEGRWITLVKTKSSSHVDKLVSKGFIESESVDSNGVRTLCCHGFPSDILWRELDDGIEINTFDTESIFYAGDKTRQIPKSKSIIIAYTKRLASEKPQVLQSIVGNDSDLLDVQFEIESGDISSANAYLWHSIIEQYAEDQGSSPADMATISSLWNEVLLVQGHSTEVEIEPVKNDQVLARAGTNIFYLVDGVEKVGTLATTFYSNEHEVRIVDPEPMWIEGSPVSRHIIINSDKVSLTQTVKTNDLSYDITNTNLSISPQDLLKKFRMQAWEPFSWPHLIRVMSQDKTHQDLSKTLQEIATYSERRLNELGAAGVMLAPTENGWALINSELVDNIPTEIKGLNGGIEILSNDGNFSELLDEYESKLIPLIERNHLTLKRLDSLSINPSDVLSTSIPAETKKLILTEPSDLNVLARALSVLGRDLEESPDRYSVFSPYNVSTKLINVGSIDLNRDKGFVSTVSFIPDGRMVISSKRLFDQAFFKSSEFSDDPASAVNLWIKREGLLSKVGTEEKESIIKSVMVMQKSLGYHNATIHNGGSLGEEAISLKLDASVKLRLQSSASLQSSSDKYLDRVKNNVISKLKDPSVSSLLLAVSKTKILTRTIYTQSVWNEFRGDYQLAADVEEAKIRSTRGYKNSDLLIFNRMELLDPDAQASINTILSDKSSAADVAVTTSDDARTDTGYVAGYAHKHLYALKGQELGVAVSSLRSVDQLNLLKKSTLWPKPNFGKLRDNGIEPAQAHLLNMVRGYLPTSFSKSAGRPDDIAEYISSVRSIREILETAPNYKQAFKATMNELGLGLGVSLDNYYPLHGDRYLLSRLGAKLTKSNRSYFYPMCNSYSDSMDIRETTLLKHVEEMGDPWESLLPVSASTKTVSHRKRSLSDVPALEHIRRSGPDFRGGKEDITEVDLIMTFGFSGVEYGNWTSQKEREQYMIYAYDSFGDLADLMKLPYAALSLGGRLGLTFGSRGHGGKGAALAHFEPSNMATALTRKKGAGSLGHEYFHALANYFGRIFTGGVVTSDLARSTDGLLRREAYNEDLTEMGPMRPELMHSFVKLYIALSMQPKPGVSITSAKDIVLSNFEGPASWVLSSLEQDKSDHGTKTSFATMNPYWSKPEELFARAMEAWVLHRFNQEERVNNYLVSEHRYNSDSTETHRVYPGAQVLSLIDVAARNFFSNIKLEDKIIQHPIGQEMAVPVMYSRNFSAKPISRESLAVMALISIDEMIGKDAGLSVNISNKLMDDDGEEVTGMFTATTGVISLAGSVADQSTINHEIYHAAKHHLLTAKEIELLDEAFSPGTSAFMELQRAMSRNGMQDLLPLVENHREEAQAYAFQLYCDGQLNMAKVDNAVQVTFTKLVNILLRVWCVAESAGFDSPSEIFNALRQGHFKDRLSTEQVHPSYRPARFAQPQHSPSFG